MVYWKFNLVHEYKLGSLIIKHYDLYRINDEKELTNIGIYEDNSDEITLIEWPEKIDKIIKNKISLFFEYGAKNDQRTLNIQGYEKIKINEIK